MTFIELFNDRFLFLARDQKILYDSGRNSPSANNPFAKPPISISPRKTKTLGPRVQNENGKNIRIYQVRKLIKFSNGALVPETTSQIDIVN